MVGFDQDFQFRSGLYVGFVARYVVPFAQFGDVDVEFLRNLAQCVARFDCVTDLFEGGGR